MQYFNQPSNGSMRGSLGRPMLRYFELLNCSIHSEVVGYSKPVLWCRIENITAPEPDPAPKTKPYSLGDFSKTSEPDKWKPKELSPARELYCQ